MSDAILVGDVGGTKIRLGLASGRLGAISLSDIEIYADPTIPSLETAIEQFIADIGFTPRTALFALAGPIDQDGSIRLTNRSWPKIVPEKMAQRLGMADVSIVNDFAAMARAIPEMSPNHFVPVIESLKPSKAPILVTGPGTGMGASTLIRSGANGWRVLTGEGGHAAFAPRTPREVAVRDILAIKHGYVSVEMIVSGRWLLPIYGAICALNGVSPKSLSAQDIMELAEARDPVCLEVCTLRANALMGAVGDAALITGARGGVVLTGGVAERTVKWLKRSEAVDRFKERGGMSPFLAHTPVRVLMQDEAPLIGAAALAIEKENQS